MCVKRKSVPFERSKKNEAVDLLISSALSRELVIQDRFHKFSNFSVLPTGNGRLFVFHIE